MEEEEVDDRPIMEELLKYINGRQNGENDIIRQNSELIRQNGELIRQINELTNYIRSAQPPTPRQPQWQQQPTPGQPQWQQPQTPGQPGQHEQPPTPVEVLVDNEISK